METTSKGKYWVWFFIWLVVIICLLIWMRQWFWLALPGTVTYFAKAMGLIDENKKEDLYY
ncbi:MAG TPA: hypothetical protein VGB84_03540 [Arachidicoccus sp.]